MVWTGIKAVFWSGMKVGLVSSAVSFSPVRSSLYSSSPVITKSFSFSWKALQTSQGELLQGQELAGKPEGFKGNFCAKIFVPKFS